MRNLLFILSTLCLFSCAREVNESARTVEERLLEARVQIKYLDTLHKTVSGAYYLIQAKGAGKPVSKETFIYVRYSTLDFTENYLEGSSGNLNDYGYYYGYGSTSSSTTKLLTTEEMIAKQVGKFSQTIYYGPSLWLAGAYSLMEGIDEVVLTMREGDKRRILLPSWLSSAGYSGSPQKHSTTTIHDIEVLRVIGGEEDIKKFQIDSLESYRDKYYPGVDSLAYGFYKKTLKEGTGDTLTTGNKLSIRYIGRTLDNFVFDTNVADSAKKFNIFNSSKEYAAIEGECKEDNTFETTDSEGKTGSLVAGFTKALFNMKHGEEAVVFFYSDLGYGYQASEEIQPFSPLVFYIKVERTNFDDDSDS